ncbi:MAG: hydrolase [Chlorobiaceae bacterium]|nr:hydrolase [Chlorobiaceae bacterium]MBA4309159.1 hydrolase [Chlorobiaceae bacterium]
MNDKNGNNFLKNSRRMKITILLISTILIVFMFPKGELLDSEINVGTIWVQQDLIAPFSFPIIKNQLEYNREIDFAKDAIFPIFAKDYQIELVSIDSLKSYGDFLVELFNRDASLPRNEIENPTFLSMNSYIAIKNIFSANLDNIFLKEAEYVVSELYRIGILDQPLESINKDSIAIRKGNIDMIEPTSQFIDKSIPDSSVLQLIQRLPISTEKTLVLKEFVKHFLRPNIFYSAELTAQETSIAEKKVSKYSGIVNENERIVAKHDRITSETKLKIDSYRIAKGEQAGAFSLFLQMVGKFFHIFALLSLLSIYIYLFRKKIYEDNTKILLFAILIVWISFVTFFVNFITVDDAIKLLIFIPTVSMLITIIFDSRIGFYTTVIVALICGAIRGNDYSFVVMNVVAGAFSVYTVRDIKNRTQIFRSFFFIFFGYTVTLLAFGLERFDPFKTILFELGFAATSALISPVLTYGLLIFFERIFKITTDLTLLELSNFDRPLMRELSAQAPGSFNHSLIMGTMAEGAAESINANPLLARVGAYYHDIGKIAAPQFFVENQLNIKNLHEELNPEESVKFIVEHVSQGIKLGEDNKLPKEILEFIPMHHGTSAITFFYEKAKKLYGEENVDIDEYRYPGPKPNSKETAIVMLADSCEPAVRSIKDQDPEKIENLVNNLIDAKISDGQLDESPLTLKDLTKIKKVFITNLMAQYHKRIRYPKQEELEKKD